MDTKMTTMRRMMTTVTEAACIGQALACRHIAVEHVADTPDSDAGGLHQPRSTNTLRLLVADGFEQRGDIQGQVDPLG